MRISIVGPLLLSFSCVAGCAQAELEYHGSNYNRAIESTSNNQLLLNIVRASKDLPLHFTGTGQYKGQKITSATLSPKLPFGLDAPLNFDLGPKLDWSSGLNSIDIGNLNTEDALSRLSAEVNLTALDSIQLSGVPVSVVMNLLFEGFQMHADVYEPIRARVRTVCAPTSATGTGCKLIREEAAQCGGGELLASARPVSFAREEFYQFPSRATSKCSFMKFQAFLAAFYGAGGTYDIRPRQDQPDRPRQKSDRRPRAPGQKPGDKSRTLTQPFAAPQAVTRKETGRSDQKMKDDGESDNGKKDRAAGVHEMHLHFVNPVIDRAYIEADARLRKKGLKAIEIRLRSPKRIIEYLGELTALQNFSEERYAPIVPMDDGGWAYLFRLLREDGASRENAILRVTGPRGEKFFVPEPDFGSSNRDRTLVVLSITSHLVNLSIQKSALPAPAAIEVRPIQ